MRLPSPSAYTYDRLVIMGVSGCGKSTLAYAIAEHLGWSMIEGDTFHTAHSQIKMSRGFALTDEDRAQWLDNLAQQIARVTEPTVLTCSALKASYRDLLRQAAPRTVSDETSIDSPQTGLARASHLGFVYMKLTQEESFQRVSRRQGHPFPASLVASQFATLESPSNESDVLTLDATHTTAEQVAAVKTWLTRPL